MAKSLEVVSPDIPRNLFILEYIDREPKAEVKIVYIVAGCIEEAIQKFRDEGYDYEIYQIYKSKVGALIY